MNTQRLLTSGLDLFEGRSGGFTKGALARNAISKKIAPNSPYAICWDAMGAILKAAHLDRIPGDGPAADAIDLLDRAAIEAGYTGSARRGDTEGRAGVIATYKRALVLLDTQGPPTRAETTEGSTK